MTDNPFAPDAVSEETRAFVAAVEAEIAKAPPTHELPVELLRTARDEGRGVFPFHPPNPEGEDIAIPGAPGGPGIVRVTRPAGEPVGLFLHIHGGGFTLGRPWHADHWTKRIADATGALVASVQYRLAPEHPWPACREDCLAAARWAVAAAKDTAAGRIVIGGESAGAHLSATTLLGMRDEGHIDAFAGALLTYGVFDLAGTPSVRNWGDRQLILSTPTIRWFNGNLGVGADDMRRPEVSPLYADLAGMPPALFQVGTWDPLLDDSDFMAARWASAGNRAELVHYPGGIHAFDYFDTAMADAAKTRATDFIAGCFAAGG